MQRRDPQMQRRNATAKKSTDIFLQGMECFESNVSNHRATLRDRVRDSRPFIETAGNNYTCLNVVNEREWGDVLMILFCDQFSLEGSIAFELPFKCLVP